MHSVAWWPMVVVLSVATLTDLRSRRIPNWLSLPFMAFGLGLSGGMNGWHGVLQSVEGFALGAVIFGAMHFMGGMGMGDVKLAAAIGAWIGPEQLMLALVVTGLAGGIMALSWAIFGGFTGELLRGSGELVFGWKGRSTMAHPELVLSNPRTRKMPYAPAIAIGTLISFFAR
ncbi:prepilin peptidase [Acidobacteria bacterium AB60]|nr:prepilin peptidase [Acidobacteria bacterium AB60]